MNVILLATYLISPSDPFVFPFIFSQVYITLKSENQMGPGYQAGQLDHNITFITSSSPESIHQAGQFCHSQICQCYSNLTIHLCWGMDEMHVLALMQPCSSIVFSWKMKNIEKGYIYLILLSKWSTWRLFSMSMPLRNKPISRLLIQDTIFIKIQDTISIKIQV